MLLHSSSFSRFNGIIQLPLSKRRYFSNSPSVLKPPYRVLLFGADDFSCHTLKALHSEQPDLIGEITVVTPPDSRIGRKLKEVHRPPLRILAEELSLESIALPTTSGLKGWEPPASFLAPSTSNLLLAASFGHLIPSRILSLFTPGNTLNVHPSLLPRYRGAAPIQWAIINGEIKTGVTVQELSRGTFDQGKLLGSKEVIIPENSSFETLEPVLAKEGATLLLNVLRDFPKAQAAAIPQDSSLATLAPKILKENLARINWESEPVVLDQLQRGVSHHFSLSTVLPSASSVLPPTHYQLQLAPFTVSPRSPTLEEFIATPIGTIHFEKSSNSLLVRAGKQGGYVIIERIKASGGKWINARDWWLNSSRRKNPFELRFK